MRKLQFPSFHLKDRFLDHLIQGVVVFSSVFLAFWLTHIRENKNTGKTVKMALENVASEMTFNQGRIEGIFHYYTKILKQIDSVETNHPEKYNEMYGYQLAGWQGVQLPMLRSSAFQTLLNSGVVKDMPFETLKSLSFIYHTQSLIERGDNAFIERAIMDQSFALLSQVKHFFALYYEILPDVVVGYQSEGRKHLQDYGFSAELSEGKFKTEIQKRMHFYAQ